MNNLFSVGADQLFSIMANQGSQMTTLSNQALNSGIDKYVKKDYKGAVVDFKRAFGLDPYSEYAIDTVKYMAMAHQQLGQTEEAIDAYQQGLRVHSDSDILHVAIGNLYIGEGRTGEAIEAYEAAVRFYDDPNNRFSLGQAYLKAGRYEDAANQFERVVKNETYSRNGYYGLGQVYSAQKQYDKAIENFQQAVRKDNEFYDAYIGMGYAYADAGDMDNANNIRDFLEFKGSDLSALLKAYIGKATPPKILLAYADSKFPYFMPPKTKLSALNSYMANANATQTFSVRFQFNKEMDRASVENVSNWNISRSQESGTGMRYNMGLSIPDTEASINPIPTGIYYDEETMTATVRFDLRQNSDGTATIDPSHILFSFNGKDADGNTMHPDYDQFMGFSKSI
jgi:tetratricopeptide (TPR) repeat protein